MRLGQLARKYGVSLNEVISYLQDVDPGAKKLGRNSKLNEQWTALVADHFENLDLLEGDPQAEDVDEIVAPPEQEPGDSQKASSLHTLADDTDEKAADEPGLEVESNNLPETGNKQEVAIETDKLLELLESEETPPDLSKFTLIKAPKRELEGLKVVGKIELPEKTRKSKGEDKPAVDRKNQKQRPQLSEEEKEKRRLRAKKKKEQYLAREEKRRKEKEKRRRKAANKARYQQKLERNKSSQLKSNTKSHNSAVELEVETSPTPPNSWLGKLWRWMNT